MDEADRIVLETLKSLGSTLNNDEETGEEITKVGEMTSEVVVAVVARLVSTVDPNLHPPSSLPPAMAARFKVATELADVVKSLGYEGEVGYETFLWVEEARVRGVLHFLVDKLPREASVDTDVCSAKTLLMRRVATVLKKQFWKPPFIHHPDDDTGSFQSHPLCIPLSLLNRSTGQKSISSPKLTSLSQQLIQQLHHQHQHQQQQHQHQQADNILLNSVLEHNLLSLLKQQSRTSKLQALKKRDALSSQAAKKVQLITASLPPSSSSSSSFSSSPLRKQSPHYSITRDDDDDDDETSKKIQEKTMEDSKDDIETVLRMREEKEEEERGRLEGEIVKLREELVSADADLLAIKVSVQETKNRTEEVKKENEERRKKMKKKNSILKLLPSGDQAVTQLEELTEEMERQLDGMRRQWLMQKEQMQQMLAEERHKGSQSRSVLEGKMEELQVVRMRLKEVTSQVAQKEALHKQLTAAYGRRIEGGSRTSYNSRILEIVNNIRKQQHQIQKVVADMRLVQADVNKLSGALSRSFVSADDVIFKAAQKDETARKAYKMLVSLHENCARTVAMVEEIGGLRKRMSDLEEQLTLAKNSKVQESLKQIESDLEALKKENQTLVKKLKTTA